MSKRDEDGNWFHLNLFKVSFIGIVMRKLLISLMLVFMIVGVFASSDETPSQVEVSYFYSTTCSHCINVADSGILEKVSEWDFVNIEKYEVSLSQASREKFLEFVDMFGVDGSIPLLVIEKDGEFSYLAGDSPIIEGLEDAIINFESVDVGSGFFGELSLGVVIVAALIDSINPCAIGVLLFLMAVLLSMGSSKRALRAGMIYTGVIFVVYFLAGLGIMRLIGSLSYLSSIQTVVGVVVLAAAAIEIKDFFWEGRGISLKIPEGTKPWLEKYVRKGTLPAIIILGALVALVELPCSGVIYLAILSLISTSGTLGILYLVIYNLVFILPLILISYMIYRGAKVNSVNVWVQNNKKYMRLAAGLIMIFLALGLLGVI